eukprot:6115423-Pleurochrysis_carterae.AAC.2
MLAATRPATAFIITTSQGAATRPSNAAENISRQVALSTERQAQTCYPRSRKKVLSKLARYDATRSENAKGDNGAHEAPMRSAKLPGGAFMKSRRHYAAF